MPTLPRLALQNSLRMTRLPVPAAAGFDASHQPIRIRPISIAKQRARTTSAGRDSPAKDTKPKGFAP